MIKTLHQKLRVVSLKKVNWLGQHLSESEVGPKVAKTEAILPPN